jgi:hypothetical protein
MQYLEPQSVALLGWRVYLHEVAEDPIGLIVLWIEPNLHDLLVAPSNPRMGEK